VLNKILLIDDCRSIHGLVRLRLRDEPVELQCAFDGESGLKLAQSIKPDLILLDVEMPEQDGFEVCRRLKADAATMSIPIIFLTGAGSTDQKIRGLELGAVDYVTKPFDPAELRARVRATLRTKYLMDLLSRKAMIDGLTGLWNRAYFDARLISDLSAAKRTGATLSCIMIDVDRFKQINDNHGHPFGDDVLRNIAQLLSDGCREEDTLCRYGGEEFAVLCPATSAEMAALLAERLRQAVQDMQIHRQGLVIPVTCSFGIADIHAAPPATVVEMADRALYEAKHTGRNRIVIASATVGRAVV
jgi:diguanylate cyclase (GGDEF)-like protein